MTKSITYVQRVDGHRLSYQSVISHGCGLHPVMGAATPRVLCDLIRAKRLVFSTIDDNYIVFTLVSLIRSALGLRTVGIFLRPSQCFMVNRYYYRWKRWLFGFLRLVPGVSVLTIIPFAIRPEFARVARDWVHDPQMWDLARKHQPVLPTPLAQSIRDTAGDRKILCFVGGVSTIKGIEFLAEIARSSPDLGRRCLIAVAGKVDVDSLHAIATLNGQGAVVINRQISDDELESLYGIADMVWACYRPDYDQASGVFGRAVQTGTLALVRKGAVIDEYARHIHAHVLALDYGELAAAVEKILAVSACGERISNPQNEHSTEEMRRSFVSTMKKWM